MRRQVIETGFIKTVSPLHITAPSNARYDLEKLSKVYGDAKSCPGSIPCTSIQTMAIPELFTKENEAGEKTVSHGLKDYPVIAANNLAGPIRRKIANVYLKTLRENGQQVNLGAYSAITCGAVTGSPDGTPVSYEDYKKAVDHPFLGLLGGGPRMILRKAKIFNSIALTHETTELLDRNRIPYEAIYD